MAAWHPRARKNVIIQNQKGISMLFIIMIVLFLAIICLAAYFLITENFNVVGFGSSSSQSQTSQTQTNPTAGWNVVSDSASGFSFKYPNNFFDASQMPKILTGDCNYTVFPGACPNINNIVAQDMISAGGDANAINSNLASPNYWQNPQGKALVINNINYCLYQSADAAMGQVYNYYYYATVVNQTCVIAYMATSTATCENYLPLEAGNTQQATNYQNCVTTNQNQPVILDQIINTFTITK